MTNGVVAWCLDLHDLWLSKAIAGRPKDYEFSRALANNGVVNRGHPHNPLGSRSRPSRAGSLRQSQP